MVFFELSVPFEQGKQKGKQVAGITPSERLSIEARIDALVLLGYTLIAINHVVQSKFQAPIPDLGLKKREGIVVLKRLTIVVDEIGEKGCGLTSNNTNDLASYDLISVLPTTQNALSLSCLTFTLPGPLTAHIISLDLASAPRLPFFLKHTLIRTAIRNGAVFELVYSPAIGGDENKRRNWWANARELIRVTNGKNIIISGGAGALADLRAPLDVSNLVTLLGVTQDAARNGLTSTPKALVLRAQTRKTYRAVLSEPRLILPGDRSESLPSRGLSPQSLLPLAEETAKSSKLVQLPIENPADFAPSASASSRMINRSASIRGHDNPPPPVLPQKRPPQDGDEDDDRARTSASSNQNVLAKPNHQEQPLSSKRKKKRKNGTAESVAHSIS